MNSKERVKIALTREGFPDRIPVQFDLCKSLIEHFGKELKIEPKYAWSYYEDLTYRISANEIRVYEGANYGKARNNKYFFAIRYDSRDRSIGKGGKRYSR